MKVLVVSKFLHHVGGVETYIDWLAQNLPEAGIDLGFFGMHPPEGETVMGSIDRPFLSPTRDFNRGSKISRIRDASRSVYSSGVANRFEASIREFQPDVLHFHGTCYQLTPSVARSARDLGVPSVLTAHEYKLVCANQRFWDSRRGVECFKCSGQQSRLNVSRNILETRCIKGTLGPSTVGALEQPISTYLWRALSPIVHAPSRFMESELRCALEAKGLRVKFGELPWPLEAVSARTDCSAQRNEVVYIGRLEPEKGVGTLLDAWQKVERAAGGVSLAVYGDGSAADELRARARSMNLQRVSFKGPYSRVDLPAILRRAVCTVHPSLWPENSPFAVRESLLQGVPAVVSDAGGLPELVSSSSGSVFRRGEVNLLADALLSELIKQRACTVDLVNAVNAMVVTSAQHLEFLTDVYSEALDA